MRRNPLVFFALLLVLAALPGAGVQLKLGNDGVTASGIVVNGQVAWVVAVRETQDRVARLAQEAVVENDWDGDGQIVYPMPNGIPEQSLWIAVDIHNGSYDESMPVASAATPQPLTSGTILADPTGEPSRLMLSDRQVRVVLVRVGTGAWTLEAADGGSMDLDGLCDGALEVSVDDFSPLTHRVSPIGRFEEQDTLVLIDLETLAYTVKTLTANDLQQKRS